MIQIYADDALVYDSRLPGYDLIGLTVDTGLNKGGAAYIQMPPGHPAFGAFTSYRTVVEIYRNGELLFRGRALYPSDDFQRCRTITCEGEQCFFHDAVIRPYAYQDSPANIFADIIGLYNAQVEAFKQFVTGVVTVTDPNGSITMENENAENADSVIDKLVERCGGYIVFTTNATGRRVINWYADIGRSNNQTIEFGENLLDYASSDENTDLATVIVPYGAKSGTTGDRITIESVNSGLDFIKDDEAVALRGVIAKPVYWDDITEPANLLAAAQQFLAQSKQIITTLTLTAVDLSALDQNIDSFRIGDVIRVKSVPHSVDGLYKLTARSFDLLHPDDDRVTLGKSIATLSGSSASVARQNENALQRVERTVKSDCDTNAAEMVASLQAQLTALVQQCATIAELTEFQQYASEQYATKTALNALQQSVQEQCATKSELMGLVFGLGGVAIPLGADLDNYKTPGVYSIATDAISAALANNPTTSAGVLRIYSAIGTPDTGGAWSLIQEIQSADASLPSYRRTLQRNSAGVWTYGTWYHSTTPEITT